ncbi:MAG: hypothetical protein WA962_05900 [Ornithinimicrobium sp.]
MEWVLAAIALALAVGLGLAPGFRTPANPSEPSTAQEQEIDAMFAAVHAESSPDLLRLLHVRTHELIGRHVPVRDIRAAPAPRVARISFSSGDVVLVTTKTPGDLITMAKAMQVTSVTLQALSLTQEGPVLRFVWNYGHRLEVYAVGLDQAD